MPTSKVFTRFAALALAVASTCPIALPGRPVLEPRRAPAPPSAPGSAGPVPIQLAPRILYVWDNTFRGDNARTNVLLEHCRANRIGMIALDCAPLGYARSANEARYRAFVARASQRGIRVLALAGDTWWTLPPNAGIPNQASDHREGWTFYSEIRASQVPFAGVLDVSDPYVHDPVWFWSHPQEAAQGLIDYLAGARAVLGNTTLYHAMPYWYDEDARLVFQLGGASAPRPLNTYVQELVNVAVVLESRDSALGPDGIVAHCQGELAAGPCILGVETQDLGPTGDALSFWEEGRLAMERELALVVLANRGNPNLRGFAFHDHASFVRLAR